MQFAACHPRDDIDTCRVYAHGESLVSTERADGRAADVGDTDLKGEGLGRARCEMKQTVDRVVGQCVGVGNG